MNDNDPNLPAGLVSVHHYRKQWWTHSQASWPNPQTWRTIAEATQNAVEWIRANPQHTVRGVTGHADRRLLRASGIRFIDSRRGPRRGRGGGKAKSFSLARERAKTSGRLWEER